MNDPRQELAAIVAGAKKFVDEERKRSPLGRVRSDTPMRSSAAVKEAELLEKLDKAPAFAPLRPAPARQVRVLFVGQAALATESSAGKLLAKIVQAMGLPAADAATCSLGELEASIARLKPAALVALGEAAAQALLKSAQPLSKLRGRFAEAQGLPLMATHHPSELLENDALKRHVWEDMKLVAGKLKA